jgi:hypothetical protein
LTTVQSASKATSPTTWSGSCPAGEWPHLLLLIGWLCVAGRRSRAPPCWPSDNVAFANKPNTPFPVPLNLERAVSVEIGSILLTLFASKEAIN